MARIQVVYPDQHEPLVDARIAALRRPSRSSYAAFLIEDDLRAAGLLKSVAGAEAETDTLLSEVRTALVEQPALKADLLDLLKSTKRARRAKAA